MREMYKIIVYLLVKKNFLRNSTPDIFIIRGGIARGKSQELYDV